MQPGVGQALGPSKSSTFAAVAALVVESEKISCLSVRSILNVKKMLFRSRMLVPRRFTTQRSRYSRALEWGKHNLTRLTSRGESSTFIESLNTKKYIAGIKRSLYLRGCTHPRPHRSFSCTMMNNTSRLKAWHQLSTSRLIEQVAHARAN